MAVLILQGFMQKSIPTPQPQVSECQLPSTVSSICPLFQSPHPFYFTETNFQIPLLLRTYFFINVIICPIDGDHSETKFLRPRLSLGSVSWVL